VIPPLLINIYMDVVVKQALAEMPDGCGFKLTVQMGSYRAWIAVRVLQAWS
jgi:hypothetical protein